MRIAWLELRRRPSRFVTAIAILTLLATLLMLLGGLLDGLLNGSTSAVAAQRGDLVVFSSTAEKSFPRSRIAPAERATVGRVSGVAAVGGIGVAQLGARVPGNSPRDLADVAMFGYELAPKGVPAPPGPGEAYADRSLETKGVHTGVTVEVGPARTPIKVVKMVNGLSYSGQGTLWSSPDTWRSVTNANLPEAGVGPGVFQALVVKVDAGADPVAVAGRIDEQTNGATETLTLGAAVDALPGVSQQRSTFNQIIGVTVGIAAVVVALFFALLTVERTVLYGVLKALGATSRTLFGGVLLQAVVVTVASTAVGTLIAVAIDVALPPGSIPYTLLPSRVLTSALLLLLAAVFGCVFSLRRVLHVDPASAIGGGQ